MPSTNQTDLAGRECCRKPGCGARQIIGSPCTDWDCPQQTVSVDDHRAALAKIEALQAERDEAH